MAVSKRTRFEVLRRDDFTCRYCRSKDDELTVDHVVPVALGGSDAPDNLVAACRSCNAGKSSIAPDAAFVEDVAKDALRWARAIAEVVEKINDESADRDQYLEYVHNQWVATAPVYAKLPADWELTAWSFRKRGLPLAVIDEAIDIASTVDGVEHWARWKYFCGICWNKLRAIEADARALINAGEV